MANKIFRFALGTAEAPCSGLWRAWTHEDEVHLAVPAAADLVALTIYPTGRWRITVGSAVSRWNRPKDFRLGWSRGPDLIIPHTDATVQLPGADPYAKEPITWLPAPIAGYQTRVSLLIATPSAEMSHWRPAETPGTLTLATLPLRTAGMLHLCRLDEPIPEGEQPKPTVAAQGPVPLIVGVSADQSGSPSFRESHGG
jgi:hypothetical protein